MEAIRNFLSIKPEEREFYNHLIYRYALFPTSVLTLYYLHTRIPVMEIIKIVPLVGITSVAIVHSIFKFTKRN